MAFNTDEQAAAANMAAGPAPSSKQRGRAQAMQLRRAYVLALAVIACLSCATYMLMDRLIAEQSVSASTINMAGRQRMLSQRVAGLAQTLAAARAGRSEIGNLMYLQQQTNAFFSSVRVMRDSHADLMNGNARKGIPGIQDEAERAYYFSEPHNIDAQVIAFLALAEEMKEAADPVVAQKLADGLSQIALYDLFNSLNAVANHDEARAHDRTSFMSQVHLGILMLTLALLLGEALLIFRPLERALLRSERDVMSAREKLLHASLHDPLTGLGNRQFLRQQADEHMQSDDASKLAVISIDLDRFKTFNDVGGHPQGDALLKTFADRLRETLREGDVAVRMGGDEFVVLARIHGEPDEMTVLCRRIASNFAARATNSEAEARVTASFGIAPWLADASFADVYSDADCALYEAKAKGRGMAVHFEPAMRKAMEDERQCEQRIASALQEGRFIAHFQPQIDMRSGRILGVEALARMKASDGSLVPPGLFLPTAERTGQIIDLGEAVILAAIEQAGRWHADGIDFGRLAINVSASQMLDPQFVPFLLDALSAAELPGEKLCVEVLESVLLDDDHDDIVGVAEALRAKGIAIDLDDFGMGHTSIANVTRLGVDRIKIDRSFVASALEDSRTRHVLTAMIAMGQAMEIDVLAEGIETDLQRRLLVDLGCLQGQGYHFAKPMSGSDLVAWLADDAAATPVAVLPQPVSVEEVEPERLAG